MIPVTTLIWNTPTNRPRHSAGHLSNIDRAHHRRCAQTQSAEESHRQQHGPCESNSCSDSGYHIERRRVAQCAARAEPLPQFSPGKTTDHCAYGTDGDGEPFFESVQAKVLDNQIDDAGNNCDIESEYQTAECAFQRCIDELRVGSHRSSS